jgi:FlaA1/EpsC-like NDP-sugar epimerase
VFQLPSRHTPRILVFLFDLGIVCLSLTAAYFIRFDFVESVDEVMETEWDQIKIAVPLFILIRAACFYFGKNYQGIIRYTSTQDTKRIFLNVLLGTLIIIGLSPIRYHFYDGFYLFPRPIIIIEFLLSLFLLITSRMVIKLLHLESKKSSEASKVIIYGAGELGRILKNTLERDTRENYQIVAYTDDAKKLDKKILEGIPVIHSSKLNDYLSRNKVDKLIVGILNPDPKKRKSILDVCLKNDVQTLSVPPIQNWLNGELSSAQIRPVKIEDLLGRQEIKLNISKISEIHEGKTILVTGGAGSIGSEIVRQIARFNPAHLLALDQAESAIYDLENECKRNFPGLKLTTIIADISDQVRIENVFKTYRPHLVYHAAAYKHVPLMEDNPSEAIKTNVLGTKILASIANDFSVEKFVMISTDKAVNPTNVMGASKRIAEIYCQSLNKHSQTQYITTRFGNVLGTNGSVIPLFKKQIAEGGPVTVTHPDITRFFMTIPEACQLVLEACTMGSGGEIYVFDMGESIKIIDLAKQMIKLSGLELGTDIEIKFSGLRPGEKLYEELLTSEENTIPTHHEKIMIGKVKSYEFEEVSQKIEQLIELRETQKNLEIVSSMKALVPEYISNNSEYSQLDKPN